MASLQDLLLMKAAEDAQSVPTMSEAATIGAGLGAVGGLAAGNDTHRAGVALNELFGREPNRFKPGNRMAGGLVGMILGGGLGTGVRQMMIENSPAAELLAKAQVQGDLSGADKVQLQNILEEVYSEMGLR